MNWEYLTGDSWGELAEKYPAAYTFILHKALVNELAALRFNLFQMNSGTFTPDPKRKVWVQQRIKDLEWALENGEPNA